MSFSFLHPNESLKLTVLFSSLSISYAAGEIERVFRGHMGRKKTRRMALQKQHTRHVYYLHYLCIQMQRCFRGYYSRKYKHDQARRKQYCRMIEEKGKEIVEKMAIYAQEQAEREAEEARIKRETDFSKLAENLHHLTSTAHIRGVYNPVIDFVDVSVPHFVSICCKVLF